MEADITRCCADETERVVKPQERGNRSIPLYLERVRAFAWRLLSYGGYDALGITVHPFSILSPKCPVIFRKMGGHMLEFENNMYNKFRDFLSERLHTQFATLGPKGTSSEAASQYLTRRFGIKSAKCILWSTYEAAAAAVIRTEADLLVVANAYRGIDSFYMSDELEFIYYFVFQTPPYGIAFSTSCPQPALRGDVRIVTHPAPAHLIFWCLNDPSIRPEIVFANSTSDAARKVAAGEAHFCMTNEISANEYGLAFGTRTRPIVMLWSVFKTESND